MTESLVPKQTLYLAQPHDLLLSAVHDPSSQFEFSVLALNETAKISSMTLTASRQLLKFISLSPTT